MTDENITLSIEDGVATLGFNRPDQLNAMNRRMMEAIIAAVGEIDRNPDARVGLITGNGRAFMAGADLKEYANFSDAEFDAFQSLGRNLYLAIEGARKPFVAAINGHAFGGGLEIALACDLVVASEKAKMGLPEILLNLIPGGGGTQRLPRKLGLTRANELLFTGRTVTAAEMYDWGVINHVYPKDSFRDDAFAFAREVAVRSPEALCILKQLTQLAAGPFNPAAQAIENEALGRFYRSAPGQEKIREFLEQSEARAARKERDATN